MRKEENPTLRPSRMRRGLVTATVVLLVLLATGFILLLHYWPFTQAAVTEGLEDTVAGKVQIAAFHSTYFPIPGCVAEGVVITESGQGSPVLIMVRKLSIQTGLSDLFRNTIREVRAEGLRVVVPPGTGLASGKHRSATRPLNRLVSKFVADGAVVEFERRGKDKEESSGSLRFEISRLALLQRGGDSPIEFHTVLLNPEPPGEISAEGEFGPWRTEEPGATAVSGSYSFQHAKLDAFKGIGGTLSSQGRFSGNLGQIDVEGTTATPDFEVRRSGHRVRLNTRFTARVDGVNGDTFLQSLDVRLQDTSIQSQVSVKKHSGNGKLTSLHAGGKGRVQDLLRLFSKDNPPAMSGAISFKAGVSLPPGHRPFLDKLVLEGGFTIEGVRFTKASTQASFEELSARAQGQKVKKPGDAAAVTGDLSAHVTLRNGVATFSGLTFTAPGASAQLSGTYNLLNEHVNLQGTLQTQASLSHAATGIKAVLLKPLDPIFKRKPAGASVGVKLAGTYEKPLFGIDLDAHK